jgi:hypothetical protein
MFAAPSMRIGAGFMNPMATARESSYSHTPRKGVGLAEQGILVSGFGTVDGSQDGECLSRTSRTGFIYTVPFLPCAIPSSPIPTEFTQPLKAILTHSLSANGRWNLPPTTNVRRRTTRRSTRRSTTFPTPFPTRQQQRKRLPTSRTRTNATTSIPTTTIRWCFFPSPFSSSSTTTTRSSCSWWFHTRCCTFGW